MRRRAGRVKGSSYANKGYGEVDIASLEVDALASVTLRRTRPSELAAVVEVVSSTASWYEPFVSPDDFESQHCVDLAWAKENYERREFWSALIDGEVVGVLTIQEAGDWLYLGYVFVHRERVGMRIGAALITRARAEVSRRGKRGMVLLAHPEATWAVRFYRRQGFVRIADDDAGVCAWNGGWLSPYHEAGFHLWRWCPTTKAA